MLGVKSCRGVRGCRVRTALELVVLRGGGGLGSCSLVVRGGGVRAGRVVVVSLDVSSSSEGCKRKEDATRRKGKSAKSLVIGRGKRNETKEKLESRTHFQHRESLHSKPSRYPVPRIPPRPRRHPQHLQCARTRPRRTAVDRKGSPKPCS